MNQELSVGIVFASSVALAWQDLKERFDKVNGSRIFFLLDRLQLLTKVSLLFLFTSHVSKFYGMSIVFWSRLHHAVVRFLN